IKRWQLSNRRLFLGAESGGCRGALFLEAARCRACAFAAVMQGGEYAQFRFVHVIDRPTAHSSFGIGFQDQSTVWGYFHLAMVPCCKLALFSSQEYSMITSLPGFNVHVLTFVQS